MGKFKPLLRRVQKVSALICLAISSFCGINLTACTSENNSPSGTNYYTPTVSREFLYNYYLLFYHYNDKDKYLGKPEDYVGKLSEEQETALSQKGIPWDYFDLYYMYAQMNDPYTYYLDPAHAVSRIENFYNSDKIFGSGFELDSTLISEKYVIKKVIPSSPADKAGIKVGDEITAIEGIAPTKELIYRRLSTDYEGETITYTIKRDSTTLTIPVVLATFLSPTVELSFKDSIPIIKILEFVQTTSNERGTYGEFMDYLQATQNYKSTILDLRNNRGGNLNQCIEMTKVLLSKGDTAINIILSDADTINKRQIKNTITAVATDDGFASNRYFVILANGMSASCSETMIAGIVSNKKFPVIGTTTYGKGIGQHIIVTPSYSYVSITDMKTYDKNMVSFHKVGIVPDFVISDNEQALEKAIELAKAKSFIRIAGYGTENTGHFAKAALEPDSMPGFYLLPGEHIQ